MTEQKKTSEMQVMKDAELDMVVGGAETPAPSFFWTCSCGRSNLINMSKCSCGKPRA